MFWITKRFPVKTFLLMLRHGDKWAFYVQHFRTTPTLCTLSYAGQAWWGQEAFREIKLCKFGFSQHFDQTEMDQNQFLASCQLLMVSSYILFSTTLKLRKSCNNNYYSTPLNDPLLKSFKLSKVFKSASVSKMKNSKIELCTSDKILLHN